MRTRTNISSRCCVGQLCELAMLALLNLVPHTHGMRWTRLLLSSTSTLGGRQVAYDWGNIEHKYRLRIKLCYLHDDRYQTLYCYSYHDDYIFVHSGCKSYYYLIAYYMTMLVRLQSFLIAIISTSYLYRCITYVVNWLQSFAAVVVFIGN